MTSGDTTWTYTYNADGLRTKRTDGSLVNTYSYVYDDGQLSYMKLYDGETLYFTYTDDGKPFTVLYDGETFYYVTNLQGDVVALLDGTGTEVVTYSYDAWGKLLSCTGTMADTVGFFNPLRYRGYVYDTETGLYYLQSRYYNPELGRFINADDVAFLDASGTLLGNNLFAYCENNPITNDDKTGNLVVSVAIGAITSAVVTYLLYLLEYELGMRNWNWWTLSGQLVLNVALGAAQGALFGGGVIAKLISKVVKMSNIAQKVGITGAALKAIKLLAKGTTFLINSFVKSITRKPGESWLNAIKRWF